MSKSLCHADTLQYINDNRLWRKAIKTKPILVRALKDEEIGREFMTADHVKQVAKEGYVLCVGVAGEPWFQKPEKIQGKYIAIGDQTEKFDFDDEPTYYHVYEPNGTVVNWCAKVEGDDIEGFAINPNYDPSRPLYSPAGGYVVKDPSDDPYEGNLDDVWLVQQPLFESTYDLV